MLFVEYPKCSTCKKAKKFLEMNQLSFTDRHIVDEAPSTDELKAWIAMSGLPIKKFFNTSGNVYKSENIKDKLPTMSDEEQIGLLGSNGMLVKRPIIVKGKVVLVGFKEDEWKEKLL